MIHACSDPARVATAAQQLTRLAPTCSGAAFSQMTRAEGSIVQTAARTLRAHAARLPHALGGASACGNGNKSLNSNAAAGGASAGLQAVALEGGGASVEADAALLRSFAALFVACLARARQWCGVSRRSAPKGGCWDAIGAAEVLDLERCLDSAAASSMPQNQCRGDEAQASSDATGTEALQPPAAMRGQQREEASPTATSEAKKGTGSRLSSPQPAVKPAATQPAPPPAPGSASAGRPAKPAQIPQTQPAEADGKPAFPDAEYDEDGLRLVYDSAPKPEVAAARAAWKALPLGERVSWHQTLYEVHVEISVPKGAGAVSCRSVRVQHMCIASSICQLDH